MTNLSSKNSFSFSLETFRFVASRPKENLAAIPRDLMAKERDTLALWGDGFEVIRFFARRNLRSGR